MGWDTSCGMLVMGCWGWDVRSGVLGWVGSGWMLRGCVGGGNLGVESRVCDVSGWVLGVWLGR